MLALLVVSTVFMVLMVYYFFSYGSLKRRLVATQAVCADEIRQLNEQHAYEMMLLRAELEPLRPYARIRDAEAEAERMMREARSQALLLKADAERYAREVRGEAEV